MALKLIIGNFGKYEEKYTVGSHCVGRIFASICHSSNKETVGDDAE